MQVFKSEAIILQSMHFQENDHILTVFSRNEGLFKVIVKGSLAKQKAGVAPLVCTEIIYTKGRSDLFKCQEISVINQFGQLRQSFRALEAASDMLQAILESQFPNHPAPILYDLLSWSLNKIASAKDPHFLAASFRLKLLKHDGLWEFNGVCGGCGKAVADSYFCAGETFCVAHAPANSLVINQEEAAHIALMVQYRVFPEIASKQLLPELREKIRRLFDELM